MGPASPNRCIAALLYTHAATGGDNRLFERNLHQHLLLDLAQPEVAVPLQNLLQGRPGGDLYIEIRIAKLQAHEFGQQYPHGAFSGTGHPDQTDSRRKFFQ